MTIFMFWPVEIAFKKIQLMALVDQPTLKQNVKGNGRYSVKIITLEKAVSVSRRIYFM